MKDKEQKIWYQK